MKKSLRIKLLNRLLGSDIETLGGSIVEVNKNIQEIQDVIGEKFVSEVLARLRDIETKTHHIEDRLISSNNILKSQRDAIPSLRERLLQVRTSDQYKKIWTNKEPLISVRIATYNRADQLLDVAIKSVLKQTYQNFEIIVVGDHCTDDTEQRLSNLKDDRIKFINLHTRSLYPEDKEKMWMVAGSPGMNIGASEASGDWIAPLDDDDEFSPDHLEKLLKVALETKSELAYGSLESFNTLTKESNLIYSEPPELGHFSFQGAIYPKLLDFFQYDQESWVVDEPGDWNLCRRMQLAGVRIGATRDVVGKIYYTPYQVKEL